VQPWPIGKKERIVFIWLGPKLELGLLNFKKLIDVEECGINIYWQKADQKKARRKDGEV